MKLHLDKLVIGGLVSVCAIASLWTASGSYKHEVGQYATGEDCWDGTSWTKVTKELVAHEPYTPAMDHVGYEMKSQSSYSCTSNSTGKLWDLVPALSTGSAGHTQIPTEDFIDRTWGRYWYDHSTNGIYAGPKLYN